MNKNRIISKLTKSIVFVILFSMIISAFSFSNVSALQVGDEIGSVLNTDIRTFINGYRIPSYNINNHSAVLIKDLINYGFDSVYNEQTRTSSVTYNPNKKITPLTNFDASNGPVGTVAFKYVYTDIVALVNGKRVESFNIKGNLAIFFGDLKDYGTFAWNNNTRESRFTSVSKPAATSVTSIALNRTSAAIRAGESLTLTAAVSPANAAAGAGLKWTSSNTNVAQVSGNRNEGYILAVSPGTATITVTSANGRSAACTVTVQSSAVAVTGITLDRTTAAIKENEWLQLIPAVTPANATDKTVTWASSNSNIAKVMQDGYIMGVAPGTATITATTASGGKTAKCTVTVQSGSIEVTNVTLSRTTLTIRAGDGHTLTATITPANATDKTVTWASSNPNIAKVMQDGYITGVAPGTATITATTASGKKTAVCTVTVQSSAVAVTGIALDKTTATIKENQWLRLIPTVTPANATDKTVIWTSSNENIAQVSQDGYIMGVTPGTATITATTASGGKTAVCTVTVQSSVIEAAGVALSIPSEVILVSETSTLTATITPADTTDKTVIWTSSNPTIVQIDNGYITGAAPGNAKITVKTANGKSAECTITVVSTTAERSNVYKTMMRSLAQNFVNSNSGAVFSDLDNSGGVIKFNDKEAQLNYIFHPTVTTLDYTQADYNKLAEEIKKLK